MLRSVDRDDIIVVATRQKLLALGGRPLLVDTGDEEMDRLLHGFTRVVTGPGQYHAYRVGGAGP